MGLLSWILIGGAAGWVANYLLRAGGGLIFDIIVGILGALVGGFIMNQFGDAGVTGWNLRSFGVAVLGSVVILAVVKLVRGRGHLGR